MRNVDVEVEAVLGQNLLLVAGVPARPLDTAVPEPAAIADARPAIDGLRRLEAQVADRRRGVRDAEPRVVAGPRDAAHRAVGGSDDGPGLVVSRSPATAAGTATPAKVAMVTAAASASRRRRFPRANTRSPPARPLRGAPAPPTRRRDPGTEDRCCQDSVIRIETIGVEVVSSSTVDISEPPHFFGLQAQTDRRRSRRARSA